MLRNRKHFGIHYGSVVFHFRYNTLHTAIRLREIFHNPYKDIFFCLMPSYKVEKQVHL